MSFDPSDDMYTFKMYAHIYNHTKGKIPLGTIHNLYILNQLKIVHLLQNGYTEEDQCIQIRKLFSMELKIRRMLGENTEI